MLEHKITFSESESATMALPQELINRGGRYLVRIDGDDVYVWGNREGLLFLGEALVRSALGKHPEGFHVHLPLDGRLPDHFPPTGSRELLLFAPTDDLAG